MSGKQFWIATLVVVALTAALATAQSEKNEVSGVIGRTFIPTQPFSASDCGGCYDPNIRFGRGLTVEGSYARRLFVLPIYSVSVEVPVAYNPQEKLHSGGPGLVPKDYGSLFVTPSVRVNLFPTTAFSLWGSFGGGVGHTFENSLLLYSVPNPGKGSTSGVLQYGVGLDVRILPRFYIRGEARNYWAGMPNFPLSTPDKSRLSNYFLGGGVLWRF
jgi:hypothetical protein